MYTNVQPHASTNPRLAEENADKAETMSFSREKTGLCGIVESPTGIALAPPALIATAAATDPKLLLVEPLGGVNPEDSCTTLFRIWMVPDGVSISEENASGARSRGAKCWRCLRGYAEL